jgi:hypothetical protein
MNELQPGADGERLPDDEWVVRVCKQVSKNGAITEGEFILSSDDRDDPKHRLSVYAERLTTAEQAFGFTNADPKNAVLGPLKVQDVRRLKAEPTTLETPSLEVEWQPKTVKDENGVPKPDTRPGAAGHCGIHDLTQGNRTQRRSLRVQLAELAQKEYERRRLS